MTSVSVVIPVLDGERYLAELLEAVRAEGADEVLVIDSGSTDRSRDVAAGFDGVRLLEIARSEFGHGRTRNLGASETSGELVCFLTQDATPLPGWLDAYREAFALEPRVGAAYGPHRPRADTSPMIARELTEFFAGFAPDGRPIAQRAGDPEFLSNVNACYSRACWEEIRFRDIDYAEDQAFGRELLERGWVKVYHPGAAVLHAHDYGLVGFMQRYFDEYRGLRESIGHVEPFGVRTGARDVRRLVRSDREWMRSRGWSGPKRAAWTARSAAHHAGRKGFSALGSRAERLPGPVQRRLSLEGRSAAAPSPTPAVALPATTPVDALLREHEYAAIQSWLREGTVPLLEPLPGMADRERLHIAMVVPSFRRGSGGHSLLFQLLWRLERMGHTCSVWHIDPMGWQREPAPVIREAIREFFAPIDAPVFKGFDDWYGADVVLATGWQTVYNALRLDGVRARAYMVNDHEPEFYATSDDSHWAAHSYGHGLFCICGSPWLQSLMTDRYGLEASVFEYGVDHDDYAPQPIARRRDTVIFYSRITTPRRATSLGVQALGELHRRRPDVRILHFGDTLEPRTEYPYEHVGIASPQQLSWLYSEATVGLSLSMTNFSLVPKEMMACGLPVVELDHPSARSIFSDGGPLELSAFDPIEIADHVERLLDDRELWDARSRAGIERVAEATWDRAAIQVEHGVREALRARERAASLTSS